MKMINNKQYDEIITLLQSYREAIDYVHTAMPERKLNAAYDFAEADKTIHAFITGLVEAEPVAASDDGWIEWGGGDCPVVGETFVDVMFRDGEIYGLYKANCFLWHHDNIGEDIVAYRPHN